MKKRVLSFILVLCMMFTLMPFSASAAEYIKKSSDPRVNAAIAEISKQNFAGTGLTSTQVQNYISHYMTKSKWAAIGGEKFPYTNSGSNVTSISDGTYSAKLAGAKGCYAYADYVSLVIYGRTGNRKGESASYTAQSFKEFLMKEAQAGEHLRIDNKHSLVFISCTDSGFYSFSYYGDSDPHIYFRYDTYSGFLSTYSGRAVWIYNANTAQNSTASGYTTPVISISGGNYPTSINEGDNFGLRGTISTDCGTLTLVRGVIYNSSGTAVQNISANPNSASYNIQGGINKELKFGSLKSGTYRYALYAKAVNGNKTAEKWIYDKTFTVKSSSGYDTPDITISPSSVNLNLTGTKSATIKYSYTGDTENGYFIRHKNSNSSVITTDWASSVEGVTVTAKGVGTSDVTIMLVEYNTEKILDSATCRVTVSCGHSYNTSTVAPTCTAGGYTLHTCKYCGSSYKDNNVSALGHDWDKGTVTKQPTETGTGIRTFHCSRCTATKTETIPKLTHTHSYAASVTKPTCTAQGYTTYTCSCGDSYKADYVKALGHDYKNGKCTRCSAKDPDYKVPNPFTDVKTSDYFYGPVMWAVENGITKGTSGTTFSPEATCTRGQIVAFLWRACGSPAPVKSDNPFKDVKSSDYFYKAVLWAVENGITKGTSATTFSPDAFCTRAQAVTFLWRAIEKPTPRTSVNPFGDVASSEYYYSAVLWAVGDKITKGTSATTFSPDDFCTRGQIVSFLQRTFDK